MRPNLSKTANTNTSTTGSQLELPMYFQWANGADAAPDRVLIVSDAPAANCEVRAALAAIAGCRFRFVHARSTTEALYRLGGGGFEIAFIDLEFGGQMGAELIRRAGGFLCPVPMVLVSATEDPTVRPAVPEGAADVVFHNDLSPAVLARVVRYAKYSHGTARALALEGRKQRKAAAGAVAASDQKSRFLASMSHEFRTPLNAILGFSEAMEQELFGEIEGGGAEKYREYIRHIHSSGAHLLSLINDLLDLSKIEAGKHELNRSAVKVEDILDDVGRMTGPQSAAAGVELAIGFAAENGLTTHADRRVLTQAVLNVTANALRFAPRGSRVMIEVTEQGGNIVLAVSDEGCGIAKSELDRIMEPFGQAAIQAQGQKGTGLGLPLSASIMQMHGGGLEIESEPGQGTRVSLWWPKDLRTEKSRNADVVSLPDVHSPRGHRTSGCEKTLSEVI